MSSDAEHLGFNTVNSPTSEYNAVAFAVAQQLARLATATVVKVVAQRGGGIAPVGFVDVQPLIQQMTGSGQPVDHGVIPNVPYFRMQGGVNAIVMDPAAGDIGIAVFSSRDLTGVKNARTAAPPGSARQYDMSDALYIGGVLNGTPTQYVEFGAAGIKMHSGVKVTIDAPAAQFDTPSGTTINGPTVLNGGLSQTAGHNATLAGNLTAAGTITGQTDVVGGGKSLKGHTHGGVQPGAGNTGAPN